jgi:hypothetical protein
VSRIVDRDNRNDPVKTQGADCFMHDRSSSYVR